MAFVVCGEAGSSRQVPGFGVCVVRQAVQAGPRFFGGCGEAGSAGRSHLLDGFLGGG